ncbi:XRE family transcriptional regulator [Streptomyces sp. LP11]|uniref:XRE family transcriptional regulator n=2 Tax=Streptomyces pyxinicus TaxID=2970331 RepID=A0ABT2B4X1_9ACTN|nr:AAA family ATPase [Streptomyces sp. LP11]MCS0603578.1 XRE family transcriptional regulator [Streptomyces sp. LP11]
MTLAYVRGCEGATEQWEKRWRTVAAELAHDDSVQAEREQQEEPPYTGLAAFRSEDAERFFGRERLVAELAGRLAGARLVTVVGASGAGKSSLLRAGLVPRWRAEHPGHPVVLFSPGPHPLKQCVTSLAGTDTPPADGRPGEGSPDGGGRARPAAERDRSGRVSAPRDSAAAGPTGSRALDSAVRRLLDTAPDTAEILLVVDQFEEVFTLCRDDTERFRFVDALLAAALSAGSRCRVVVGVRADFYAHCAAHPALAAVMADAQVVVGPMSSGELRRAVTRPAVRAGCTVEGALLADIMTQADGQAAMLPLVSHALLETWRRRRGNTLTLSGFQAAGGLDGGLAHTAEEVWGTLDPVQQRIARQVLMRLTALGEGTEDTRRRIRRDELDSGGPVRIGGTAGTGGAERGVGPDPAPGDDRTDHVPDHDMEADTALVLERFARARLLTLDRDTLEITHEALIRSWPRLRGWLTEDRDALRVHRHLTEAAADWEAVRRDPGALYRGVRLDQACEWAARAGAEPLSSRERQFLAASRMAREAEVTAAARGTRRLRRLSVLLAVLLAGTAAATGVAVRAERQASRQRDTAISQRVAQDAVALRLTDPARAVQLALAAYRLQPTSAARSAVLSAYATPYATQLTGSDTVEAVAYAPGGRLVATAGDDGAVRLVDTTDPGRARQVAAFSGHTGPVRGLAFSPSGKLLASAGADGTLRLWDPHGAPRAAGRAVGTAAALPGSTVPPALVSVAFSPDGATVAAAGADGAVRIWRTAHADGAPVVVLADRPGELRALAFAPDGRRLAAAGPAGTALWRLGPRTGRVTARLPAANAVAFAPDGRTLATAGEDYAVRRWRLDGDGGDRHPSRLGAPLTGHTDTVNALAYSADGRVLASGGVDATVRLWNVAKPGWNLPPTVLSGHTGYVSSLAFAPDGHTLASGSSDRTLRLWDLPVPALTGHTSSLYAAGFSPDGRTLATGSYDHTVRLWDVSDPRRPAPGAVLTGNDAAVNAVAFAPGGHLLASAGLDRTVRLWDVADVRHPRPTDVTTAGTDAVNSLAFAPDGHTLATGGADRSVRLWAVAGNRLRPLTRAAAHRDQVGSVAFSPDGRLLASASRDRTVRLWDTAGGRLRPVAVLTGHSDAVKAVAFAPDGRTLATASDDRTLRLWDVRAARDGHPVRPLAVVEGHTDAVKALAFTADSRTLASGGADHSIRLWDVTDPGRPAPRAVLSGHGKPVDALAFAPDGHTLASGSEDWTGLLWETRTARVAARICRTIRAPGLTPADWQRYLPGLPYRPPCAHPR